MKTVFRLIEEHGLTLHGDIEHFAEIIRADERKQVALDKKAENARELGLDYEPVQDWKWHQAPVKTSWGHDMVVADLAIDKDNTVSVYCERDQTAKVEAMFTPPAAHDLQAELDATNRQVEILSDALAESRREVDAMIALARADEREACAKVCDSLEEQCEKLLVPDEKWPTPADCAHIIRARGNT
jgi:hypothetical protein